MLVYAQCHRAEAYNCFILLSIYFLDSPADWLLLNSADPATFLPASSLTGHDIFGVIRTCVD